MNGAYKNILNFQMHLNFGTPQIFKSNANFMFTFVNFKKIEMISAHQSFLLSLLNTGLYRFLHHSICKNAALFIKSFFIFHIFIINF